MASTKPCTIASPAARLHHDATGLIQIVHRPSPLCGDDRSRRRHRLQHNCPAGLVNTWQHKSNCRLQSQSAGSLRKPAGEDDTSGDAQRLRELLPRRAHGPLSDYLQVNAGEAHERFDQHVDTLPVDQPSDENESGWPLRLIRLRRRRRRRPCLEINAVFREYENFSLSTGWKRSSGCARWRPEGHWRVSFPGGSCLPGWRGAVQKGRSTG